MTRRDWHLAGGFLFILALVFFFVPILNPHISSSKALGFSILLSPGTLVAALICLFE